MSSKARQQKAIESYEAFTGHDADEAVMVDMPDVEEAWVLGELTGLIYEAVRDGEKERYIHEFKKSARPILAVSSDNKQLIIVGGSYEVLDTGINDR